MSIKQTFNNAVRGKNHHWWVLWVTSCGTFMTTYDLGAVSMSLPQIMASFKTSLAFTAWVLLAQLLTSTALLLPAGRLGDIVGRKKVYNIGFLIFITGSALAGLSQNLAQLVMFRILQASGAAMLQTNNFAIVAAVFPDRDRGKGLGTHAALAAIGATAGPALGGLILGLVGWRGIFFLNVPVGLMGALLAYIILDEKRVSPPREKVVRSFDFPGAAIATVAVGSLLLGLSFGQERSWGAMETRFLLLTSAVALVAFPLFESRQRHPLVDTALLRNRTFAFNQTARLIMFLAIASTILLMPFYMQVVMGYSPFQTGMVIAPMSVVVGAVSPVSGWLTNRIATRFLSAFGMAVMGFGLFLTAQLTPSSTSGDIVWRVILIGIGHGVFQTPNNTSIMDSVGRESFGISSGIMSLVREIGRAVGTSLASVIVVSSMFSVVGPISLWSLKRQGASALDGAAILAFADGISKAFLAGALLCIPGIILCLTRGKTARDRGKLE